MQQKIKCENRTHVTKFEINGYFLITPRMYAVSKSSEGTTYGIQSQIEVCLVISFHSHAKCKLYATVDFWGYSLVGSVLAY